MIRLSSIPHVKRRVSSQLVESKVEMKRLALGTMRRIQKLSKLVRSCFRQDNYFRTLQIQGAKTDVLLSKNSEEPITQWAKQVCQRCGWQKAVVTHANKNAWILWTVMTGNNHYDALLSAFHLL